MFLRVTHDEPRQMGDTLWARKESFQFTFNGFLKVTFQGSRVTSDADRESRLDPWGRKYTPVSGRMLIGQATAFQTRTSISEKFQGRCVGSHADDGGFLRRLFRIVQSAVGD